MNIASCVQHIYPDITIGELGQSECAIANYGNGDCIAEWSYHQPQPTAEQLADAWASVLATDRADKINLIRAKKEQLPIEYDNKLLDADDAAIKNINGKILELESKQALGIVIDTNTLFWRDANDTTHVWTDAMSYLNWLRGLAIAIAERTSLLYYIAWQKKSDNADIEAGW